MGTQCLVSVAVSFPGLVGMGAEDKREGGDLQDGSEKGGFEAMWQKYVERLRLLEGEGDRRGSCKRGEHRTHRREAQRWRGVRPLAGVWSGGRHLAVGHLAVGHSRRPPRSWTLCCPS